jgi:hypothetical protein
LDALTSTDAELQALAITGTPVDETQLRSSWRKYSLLALRYEVDLLAPRSVVEAAESTYRHLRNIRNVLGTTALQVGSPGSPEWEAAHRPYVEAIDNLRGSMRADIQGLQL